MPRRTTLKRGRIAPVLVAGGIGYLIGGWHATVLRDTDFSAAQSIALRFPQDWNGASLVTKASVSSPAIGLNTVGAMNEAQLALFSPEPMVPPSAPQAAPQTTVQAATPLPTEQTAAAEMTTPSPASAASEQPRLSAAATPAASAIKAAAAAARRHANRPGYLLDDAQIASIKQRLHLTPDQERMWPAVETALRNVAYAHAQADHRRAAGAGAVQAASIDPNSAEVQGLRSAAVPLIMSFNAEQKDEVRNLVHVMGLDQLASQF